MFSSHYHSTVLLHAKMQVWVKAVQFGPDSAQVLPPLAPAHYKYIIIGIVLGVPT